MPSQIYPRFRVWRTIQGLNYRTGAEFFDALLKREIQLSPWVKFALFHKKFALEFKGSSLDLIKVSLKEMGFDKIVRFPQIEKRVEDFGLELCPSECGPSLRLQYDDQPKNEKLFIGMKPIGDSDFDSGVFKLWRGAHSYLESGNGNINHPWSLDCVLILVRPQGWLSTVWAPV